jgi:membrane protein insertase Oxa1/YidC/SpoIIIJ
MSSSLRFKKVDLIYARIAASLVVIMPTTAFFLRLYKDSLAEYVLSIIFIVIVVRSVVVGRFS